MTLPGSNDMKQDMQTRHTKHEKNTTTTAIFKKTSPESWTIHNILVSLFSVNHVSDYDYTCDNRRGHQENYEQPVDTAQLYGR
jgi:hypothetical protein